MVEYRLVPHLPDLIHPEDDSSDPGGQRIRVRICATAGGIELIADGMRPEILERLLAALGAEVIERTLCG